MEGAEGCFHSFGKSSFIDCVALRSLYTSEELFTPRLPRPVSPLISSSVALLPQYSTAALMFGDPQPFSE